MHYFKSQYCLICIFFIFIFFSMAVDDDKTSEFPRFMKIVLAPRLDLQKLEIPPKFVQRYGVDVVDVVELSVPGGAIWQVKVMREKGRVWLQNGWPEFVSFYSIEDTHVLVFTFEGNSKFHVIIMSSTATEIEYPLSNIGVQVKPSLKRENIKQTIKSSAPMAKKAKVAESVRSTNQHRVIGSKWNFTPDELERIKGYPSEQPSFVVKLSPSQVEGKFYGVNIPLEFVRRYLHHELGIFILENVTQKKWPMRVKTSSTHVTFKTKGWRNFTLENGLQAGNICIFELMKDNKRRFKVSVLQTEGEPSKSKAQVKSETDN